MLAAIRLYEVFPPTIPPARHEPARRAKVMRGLVDVLRRTVQMAVVGAKTALSHSYGMTYARAVSSIRPFVFGLDLTYKSHGALAFGAWLRTALTPDEVEAVHVLSASGSSPRAQVALHEQLAGAGHAQTFARIQVLEAPGIVEELGRLESFARALVLGRRARGGERALVHLGPVARKLLRGLPLPTIVVPPELEPAALGGPVVLATDLEAHSDDAARFAARFARECGCALIVVHVAEVHLNEYVDEGDPDWLARKEQFRREAAAGLDRWADEHGLDSGRRIALCGSPIELLLELAERERPSLLVLGSRRLTATQRLFTTSTASTMAAYSVCPVAVVPPSS